MGVSVIVMMKKFFYSAITVERLNNNDSKEAESV